MKIILIKLSLVGLLRRFVFVDGLFCITTGLFLSSDR